MFHCDVGTYHYDYVSVKGVTDALWFSCIAPKSNSESTSCLKISNNYNNIDHIDRLIEQSLTALVALIGSIGARYMDSVTQQTENICITFVQRRPNVFDVGPTLYKCYTNQLCLLGIHVAWSEKQELLFLVKRSISLTRETRCHN